MGDRSPEARRARVAAALAWLERHRPLLDDPVAFRAALDEPPPVDLLALPRRRTPAALVAGLTRRGLTAETFDAAPLHVRVHGQCRAGSLPEVVLGFAHPQGVASALAPQALAPRPGELMLDLCAAPGGKTVLLDALAGGRAGILAGEPSVGRAGILVQTLARSGVAAAVVVQQDGRSFPAAALFDTILLDAPCTGEGTFRVPAPRFDVCDEQGVARSAALQRRLLRRALDLLAAGGRLVYATCSYNPEENELVLDAVLAERDDIELIEPPPATPGVAGVTAWGGRALRPDLARARRVFPHHLGSWGFFLALLLKDQASTRVAATLPADGRPRQPLSDDPEARRAAVRCFEAEYGVAPAVFDEMLLFSRGRAIWAARREVGRFDLSRLRVVAPALRLLRRTPLGLEATNAALRCLGPHIRRAVVDLSFGQAVTALTGPGATITGAPDRPLLAVRVDGVIAGKGCVRDGCVAFALPSAWR